ncbi:MAG: flagellar motor protein MotB [Phycisphaerales bacterium JB043]
MKTNSSGRTHRFGMIVGGAALAVGLGGCVQQREYDSLYSTNRTLEERNVALAQDLESQETSSTAIRQRLDAANAALAESQSLNDTLQGEIDQLRADYMSLSDRLTNVSLAAMDPATDRALRDLASQNPDLITYDSATASLRFASDLTFGSGSDQLTPQAVETLKRLAGVLSNVMGRYEMRIVGHTDNVQPSAATQRRHPSNMHLSAHRAIAVFNTLRGAGIAPTSMEVAGRGEFLPATANRPGRAGTAANRRVEIFLVPARDGYAYTNESPAQEANEPVRSVPNPMK